MPSEQGRWQAPDYLRRSPNAASPWGDHWQTASLDELAGRLAAAPTAADLHLYGLRAAAAGQFEAGLAALIRLLREYPDYREGAARTALLKVFDCLPKGDPLASRYRRQMFNALH